jgi:cytochrome c
VYRLALVLLTITYPVLTQQPAAPPKTSPYAAIPVEDAKQQNPVKPSPESVARAKKWWTMDCEMCHGKAGDGKGDTEKK